MTVDEFIEKGFLEEMNQKLPQRIPHALRDGDGVYNVVVKSTGIGGKRMAVFFMGTLSPRAVIIFNDDVCSFAKQPFANIMFSAPTLSAENNELSEFLTKLYTGL